MKTRRVGNTPAGVKDGGWVGVGWLSGVGWFDGVGLKLGRGAGELSDMVGGRVG